MYIFLSIECGYQKNVSLSVEHGKMNVQRKFSFSLSRSLPSLSFPNSVFIRKKSIVIFIIINLNWKSMRKSMREKTGTTITQSKWQIRNVQSPVFGNSKFGREYGRGLKKLSSMTRATMWITLNALPYAASSYLQIVVKYRRNKKCLKVLLSIPK